MTDAGCPHGCGLLTGKTAIVTGGSRGIGAAVVRRAVAEGADVAFTYRNGIEAAKEIVDDLTAKYPDREVRGVRCDVTDEDEARRTVRDVAAAFGRVDVLVNNAGVVDDAVLGRMTRAQWDNVIGTNLGGLYNMTRPLLMQMVRQRSASVVNLTSIAGVYGTPGQTNYATSKAGVIGFTKSLSKEVAPMGVRVNAVAPGFIETDMLTSVGDDRLRALRNTIPAGRWGTEEEVADLICFLGSSRATYITGQVIHVDGGVVI